MASFINQIQSGSLDTDPEDDESRELVSKLPPENVREADLVLGVLFNGYSLKFNK